MVFPRKKASQWKKLGDVERGGVVVREWQFHSCTFRDRTVLGKDQIKGVPMSMAVRRGN